jgi:hypothetical protein
MYQFQVLPLGISCAVALFQNSMEILLGEDLLNSGVRIYLDDILSFSIDMETHVYLLDRVLSKLNAAQLKIKREKFRLGEVNLD